MKFITEEDLRDIYKKQPFTDYDLQPGERLTPGARQFLVDRGINMYDKNDPFISSGTVKAETSESADASAGDRKKRKFCSRLKSLQALFLLTAEELMKQDVCMSQQITGLYRQFACLGSAAEGKCEAADLCCKACTGINADNFSRNIGDCFEITEFHMQLEKGHEILLLTRLRSSLEELDAELEDFIRDTELQNTFSGKLNQIINTLSQMICCAVGGKECQRN
ncbi:MAG: cobalamin adenosyltransferase [Lentihominibacter sp.]